MNDMVFFIIIAVMLLMAVSFFLLGDKQNREHADIDTAERDKQRHIALYHNQMKELTRDYDRGILSQGELEQAELELKRRLLKVTKSLQQNQDLKVSKTKLYRSPLGRSTTMMIVVLTFFMMGGGYFILGSAGMPDFPYQLTRNNPEDLAEIEKNKKMILKIKDKIEQNRNDKMGHFALGFFYQGIGERYLATESYEKALELDPNNYDTMMRYGESLMALNDERISPAAQFIFNRAIKLDPLRIEAPYYLILKLFQAGQEQAAKQKIDILAQRVEQGHYLYETIMGLKEQIDARLKEGA